MVSLKLNYEGPVIHNGFNTKIFKEFSSWISQYSKYTVSFAKLIIGAPLQFHTYFVVAKIGLWLADTKWVRLLFCVICFIPYCLLNTILENSSLHVTSKLSSSLPLPLHPWTSLYFAIIHLPPSSCLLPLAMQNFPIIPFSSCDNEGQFWRCCPCKNCIILLSHMLLRVVYRSLV